LLVPQLARDARGDLYGLGLAAAVVDCAALADSGEIVGVARDLLAEAFDRHVVLTTGWVSLVTRALGVASACLGHTDAAARWFEGALASSREIGARAEHLQTMVAFARMLLREGGSGNTRRALELLALAVPQLRDLGMSPLLATATQLARLRKPSPIVRAARGRRRATTAPGEEGPLLAIMFTDISGSTAMYERLGDAAGRALVRVHDGVVRDWLARCDGTLMKHTGDGVEAAFRSVSSAIDCAIAIQRALARHTRRHPDRPLRVRIGINVGEPLAEDGDLFGSAVNTAARVCARAKGGEILVTQAVRQLADGHDTRFRARGIATLRGVRSRVHLFAVAW
jgi:class 3 adenylate cyclase